MDPRSVFIMAGGRQVRWGNRGQNYESKHMVLVPAACEEDDPTLPGEREPLMVRTLNQLRPSPAEIDGVTVFSGTPLKGPLSGAGLHILTSEELSKRFLARYDHTALPDVGQACCQAIANNTGVARRLVFLMGDVYWEEEDLYRLLKADTKDPVLATDGVDTFGFSFPSCIGVNMLAVLHEWGRTNKLRSGFDARGIHWDAQWVRSWTQDFDIDFEHLQFMHGMSKNNLFRQASEQIKLRRALRKTGNPKSR